MEYKMLTHSGSQYMDILMEMIKEKKKEDRI